MTTSLPLPRVADASGETTPARLLRLLAGAGIALVVVIVVASAYMRLSAAGLSCADWPACYGRIANAIEPALGVRFARIAHRFAATAVAALIVALVALSFAARPPRASRSMLAAGALAVVVGLAVLGIATSKLAAPALPAITLANLLGGFLLLALLAALYVSASDAPRAVVPAWVRALAAVALVIAAIQAVLGAYVSARFAGLACPTFPLCGATWPPGSLAGTLDPLSPLTVDVTGAVVRGPDLAALQWTHRIGAHAVLFVAIALAIGLFRAGHKALCAVVIAPVIVELALGASAVSFGLPFDVVLAHNLVAALLLATLAAINAGLRVRAS